jgi:hypothetical protein
MNIFQSILQTWQQPPMPVHTGEAFTIWSFYIALVESRALCLLLLNHTNDTDLRGVMEHFVADMEEPATKRLTALMKEEGMDFPNVTADKAKADCLEVPAGAKFTEAEIANLLVVKIEGIMLICHMGIVSSIRTDLSAMWFDFYSREMALSIPFKTLMQKRGWLRIPPYFNGGANRQDA